MKHQLYILLFLVGGIIAPFSLRAQAFNDTIDRTRDDFVIVSLVICDPAEVLYSTLGHAALHLQCPTFDLDYIFTYESESVTDKIAAFLRGDLKMGMFAVPTAEFLSLYEQEGRGVKEYKMNLEPAQKQELWRVMDEMVAQGPDLPYDYFHRGCAKSVVYVIKKVLGPNAIHYAPWTPKYTDHTMRELGCAFVTNAPSQEFILHFLIGIDFDRDYPCEQKLIIPTDLVEVWQQATFDNGQPVLAATPQVLVPNQLNHKNKPNTPLWLSLVVLLLSLVSLATYRFTNTTLRIAGTTIDYITLTLITLLGALETYLICFSSLPCTDWNWLIIPFNILPALGWHWRKYWALPYAIVLMIWMIAMLVYPHTLVDPSQLVLTAAFSITLLKQHITHNT